MARPRVLVVHNRYLQRGGEDVVVDAEVALLRARGHDVEVFERSSARLATSPLAMARDLVWNRRTADELAQVARRFDPDVVHVHNTFPYISPAAYSAVRGRAVVQTLHNFRLLCPQAMLLRQGAVCEDCVGRVPWRGALRGCYRDSRAHSAVIAGMLVAHRALGTWRTAVTRYIALNEFGRAKFIEGGLPAARIAVKPNFVDVPGAPPAARRDGFLFVGRLSPEKGVDVLCRAAALLGGTAQVRMAGCGPLEQRLVGAPGVTALGALQSPEVLARMRNARALVLPSVWYEMFPVVVVEAYACGLPVIASRLGAMATIVQDGQTGLLFAPGDADDLAAKLRWALAHPHEMAAMGERARAQYEARYTPERNYAQLAAIYADAMAQPRHAAAGGVVQLP